MATMRVRPGIWLVTLLSALVISEGVLYFLFFVDLAIPEAPGIGRTLTPKTKGTPQEIGAFDVLGRTVSRADADKLRQSDDGRRFLAPENGAVEITQDLLDLGRRAFYEETFGNEVFL